MKFYYQFTITGRHRTSSKIYWINSFILSYSIPILSHSCLLLLFILSSDFLPPSPEFPVSPIHISKVVRAETVHIQYAVQLTNITCRNVLQFPRIQSHWTKLKPKPGPGALTCLVLYFPYVYGWDSHHNQSRNCKLLITCSGSWVLKGGEGSQLRNARWKTAYFYNFPVGFALVLCVQDSQCGKRMINCAMSFTTMSSRVWYYFNHLSL